MSRLQSKKTPGHTGLCRSYYRTRILPYLRKSDYTSSNISVVSSFVSREQQGEKMRNSARKYLHNNNVSPNLHSIEQFLTLEIDKEKSLFYWSIL